MNKEQVQIPEEEVQIPALEKAGKIVQEKKENDKIIDQYCEYFFKKYSQLDVKASRDILSEILKSDDNLLLYQIQSIEKIDHDTKDEDEKTIVPNPELDKKILRLFLQRQIIG